MSDRRWRALDESACQSNAQDPPKLTVPEPGGKCFGTFSRFSGWVVQGNGHPLSALGNARVLIHKSRREFSL